MLQREEAADQYKINHSLTKASLQFPKYFSSVVHESHRWYTSGAKLQRKPQTTLDVELQNSSNLKKNLHIVMTKTWS